MAATRASARLFTRHFTSRTPFQTTRSNVFRRHQTTTAGPAVEGAPKQTIMQRLWTSEIGIRTVHFWAPVMKWGVVAAGAADFMRPAEKLSLTQNMALMATGALWTRWCFVIKPKNVLLAAVNFCLFTVGTIQVSRILMYQREQQGSSQEALKVLTGDVVGQAEKLENKAEKSVA